MADYPSVFPEGPVFPVAPGGAQARIPRRRNRREEKEPPRDSYEAVWRRLLEEAVADLNEEFHRTGAPYACLLLEDDTGFLLRVSHLDGASRQEGDPGIQTGVADELLEPADLPVWLARLRAGIGILVDRAI